MTGPSENDDVDAPQGDLDRRASDELDAWLSRPAHSSGEPLSGRAAEMLSARRALGVPVGGDDASELDRLVTSTMERLETAGESGHSAPVRGGDAPRRRRVRGAPMVGVAAAAVIVVAGLVIATLSGPSGLESADDSASERSTADATTTAEPAQRSSTADDGDATASAGGAFSAESDAAEPGAPHADAPQAGSSDQEDPDDEAAIGGVGVPGASEQTRSPFAGVRARGTIELREP